MLYRLIIIGGVASSLAGCASELAPTAGFGPTGSLQAAADQPSPTQMPAKTMSDRVLTAIALERVTGLKPDPARLAQP